MRPFLIAPARERAVFSAGSMSVFTPASSATFAVTSLMQAIFVPSRRQWFSSPKIERKFLTVDPLVKVMTSIPLLRIFFIPLVTFSFTILDADL